MNAVDNIANEHADGVTPPLPPFWLLSTGLKKSENVYLGDQKQTKIVPKETKKLSQSDQNVSLHCRQPLYMGNNVSPWGT